PSRRMRTISVTRASTWALVGCLSMAVHHCGNPARMKVNKAGVIDHAKLFAGRPVGTQVRAALDGKLRPVGEGQGHHLAVRRAAGGTLTAAAELLDGFLPQFPVVRPKENARQQGERIDLPGVQPTEHCLEIATVVTQGRNERPVATSHLVEESVEY